MNSKSGSEPSWKAALESCGEWVDALSFDRAHVNRKGTRLTLCFTSSRFMDSGQVEAIKKAYYRVFPGVQIYTLIRYPAMREKFLTDFDSVKPYVINLLSAKAPGIGACLSRAIFSFGDGTIKITLDETSHAVAQEHEVPKVLAALAKEVFDAEVEVALEIEGRTEAMVLDMREKRRRREELLSTVLELPLPQKPSEPGEPEAQNDDSPPDDDENKIIVLAKERGRRKSKSAIYGGMIYENPVPICDLREDSGQVAIQGDVVDASVRELSGGETMLFTFLLTDYSGTIQCKAFVRLKSKFKTTEDPQKRVDELISKVKEGASIKALGECRYDSYAKEITLIVSDINPAKQVVREDKAEKKRVELHAHTQMSSMDAVVSAKALIKQAAKWGHPAIAITDHGVVQAFPEAFAEAKQNGIHLIPGLEGYLVDDHERIVDKPGNYGFNEPVVVFDFETTGLSAFSDRITEIGAVRFENGVEVGAFSTLVNPKLPIPAKVSKLTGITDAMVRTAPTIDAVIGDFVKFCEGAVLAAHNASFDMGFLKAALKATGVESDLLERPVIDTLAFSRIVYRGIKNHKLGTVAQYLGIRLTGAHRAVNDARACMEILERMIIIAKEKGNSRLCHLNEWVEDDDDTMSVSSRKNGRSISYHVVLLAKTQSGLANIYRLVSESHLNHFHRRPMIPRSLLSQYREGIIVGSACEAGELYRAVLRGADDTELRQIASFYDYLEIQSERNNAFLVRLHEVSDEGALRDINNRIIALGEELSKPVVVAGDVHFLNPRDEVFRRILMAGMGFDDSDEQPPLYFKTTDELLEEFSYLGEEKAMEIVVDNTVRIAESIEEISLFPKHPEGKETFQPIWPNAEEDIKSMSYKNAEDIYGSPLPDIVKNRLEKELGSIIGHGFASLYMIACLLVKKSLDDGYLVGSRGSVGSSLVATLVNITEVNPLPSHYVCPLCRYSDFEVDRERYPLGFDLPDAECPHCSSAMKKNGVDIPFEVFLGFYGDKVPDIDLNFSGDYQAKAHEYVETLFGKGNTFRAGTIGTLADKTAFGFVSKYLEQHNIEATRAEIDRLVKGCVGVKRTTGQHPGGMVVLPQEYEIYQFTPIQRPADDVDSDTLTTHFDFNSMHDTLVKLDILGHDDPTMIRMLEDITGKKALEIPLDDRKVLSLFSCVDALCVDKDELGTDKGTLGVPEFGTKFVRQMLEDTKPKTISELVRISGLSHGTDVWLSNAQDIIKKGIATLSECICTRDDIMNYLITMGVPDKMAFDTMESVRKGKGLKPEMEEAMVGHGVPEWFVDSCKKIKYMFPKAHAVAYVTMALRIAYYKVYHSVAYYCAFFSVRGDAFDANMLLGGVDMVRARMELLLEKGKEISAKESNLLTLMEIVIEMNLRGILFMDVDLYASHETLFEIVDGMIRPPLRALPGLGENAAASIVRGREMGEFLSVEDMQRRTKISRTVVEILKESGCLDGMPETSQVSLF